MHGLAFCSELHYSMLYLYLSAINFIYCSIVQGQDGVDLEMNLNGNKSIREDDEFSDLVKITLFSFFFFFNLCLISFVDLY